MSKTILAEVEGFTPLLDGMVQEMGLITAAVFGKVWRYCQMKDGLCNAAQERMAGELKITRVSMNMHIGKLVEAGYLEDLTPGHIGIPHQYKDTGKAGLSNKLTGYTGVVNEIDNPCKNALQGVVNEIDTKIVLKKELREITRPLSKIDLDQCNAKIDAILKNERQAQNTWSGREKIPEPIRELLDVYVQITGQKPTKGQLMDWLSTGQEWMELEINAGDLRRAYARATPSDGRGFAVTRPGSLTTTAGAVAGERRKAHPIVVPLAQKPKNDFVTLDLEVISGHTA
jgi:hypothetical protein